jgi:hypothetical protein
LGVGGSDGYHTATGVESFRPNFGNQVGIKIKTRADEPRSGLSIGDFGSKGYGQFGAVRCHKGDSVTWKKFLGHGLHFFHQGGIQTGKDVQHLAAQGVSADFVPWECALVNHAVLDPLTLQEQGSGRAGRSGTHDEHVGF